MAQGVARSRATQDATVPRGASHTTSRVLPSHLDSLDQQLCHGIFEFEVGIGIETRVHDDIVVHAHP
jgi:hypothetical protein